MKATFSILKKFLKWFFIVLLGLFLLANVFILVTGRTYIYKAVACTYLVGQSGPGILDLNYFPSREVAVGNPQPWPTHKRYGTISLSAEEQKRFEKYHTTSYLLFYRDSLLFEKYWDDFSETTISNSFSAAKAIVSILVGIAIDEGKIKGVDQPVSDFIPSYKEGNRSKLTLYHLLTMSAAMEWSESGGNPLLHNAEAYYGSDLVEMINEVEVNGEPGKIFNYQSGATLILGYCVEIASGMKLSEYASQKLWIPMGAEHTSYWSLDQENGVEKSYCCYYATGRDFARFGKLYLDSGKWNGQQLVSAEWVQQSIRPADLLDEDGKKNDRYGYCWWITEYEGNYVYYMRGILGQYVICLPEKELIIVRTGHKRGDKRNDQPMDLYEYIDVALDKIESLK